MEAGLVNTINGFGAVGNLFAVHILQGQVITDSILKIQAVLFQLVTGIVIAYTGVFIDKASVLRLLSGIA